MLKALRVGIVGAGTAGTAAACFLARLGHLPTLYERVPEPGPVGAGIILQPLGMAVLQALGLRDEVVARGAPLEGLTVSTPSGRQVLSLDYAQLGPDLYGVGLHRGALFQGLERGRRALAVPLETGIEVSRIEHTPEGSYLCTSAGERRGPHDLILLCDGSRSRVAESYFPQRRSSAYPWGALWFVGRDAERRFSRRLEQTVRGAERMIGLLPTGLGPQHEGPLHDAAGKGDADVPLVSLFYSVRGDRVAAVRRDLSAWKGEVLGLAPRAEPLLEQIHDESALIYASYQDVRLWPWHRDNVLALGDAAHAMSPQLGQGANLALWDAFTLSHCLDGASTLPEALSLYSRRRRAHLGWFQWATRFLTPFFQGDSQLLGQARDVFLPTLARVGPFRRLMIASMVGDTRGPLRRSLALPSRPATLLLGNG